MVKEAGIVLLASNPACQLLKYAPGELTGQNLEILIPERYRPAHVGHRLRFTDDRRKRAMGAGPELFALCKDGSERRVDISLSPFQQGLETLIIATLQSRESN